MDLGKYLAQTAGPNLGTQERIEYLPLNRLEGDERNFYALSDIDALAANIELIGLQQPIRVREAGNKYRIISGHRRHAAIRKLVSEGSEAFETVACIVENVECSEAMQELRLIYANSDTRKMSSADLSRQAERVEALLYQLKEEGFEFPGRMRDHVAQACQTTKSKLSRLKVIRERLHKTLLNQWEAGKIKDSVAYRIAQEASPIQNSLVLRHADWVSTWTEEIANNVIEKIKHPTTTPPVSARVFDAKAMANDYLERRAEENFWFFENMRKHIFDMMIGGFTVIPSRQDGIQYLKDYHSNGSFWGSVHFDRSKTGLEVYKDDQSTEKTKRSWVEVWDTMACIALQKCAAEHNKLKKKEPEPVGQLVFNGWMPGGTNPATPCDVVAVFDFEDGGEPYKKLCYWNGYLWKSSKTGTVCEMQPSKWMALPPDEE